MLLTRRTSSLIFQFKTQTEQINIWNYMYFTLSEADHVSLCPSLYPSLSLCACVQGRPQDFFPGVGNEGIRRTEVPQRCPEVEPWWGARGKAPRS